MMENGEILVASYNTYKRLLIVIENKIFLMKMEDIKRIQKHIYSQLETSNRLLLYLQTDVDENDKERKGEVEQKPDLYRLDIRGGGQASRHREIDGGQDHHAGDIDGVDQAELVLTGDEVSGLVDDVHEDTGDVGDHDDTKKFPSERHGDLDGPALLASEVGGLSPPPPDDVLLDRGGAHVGEVGQVERAQQIVRPLYPELQATNLQTYFTFTFIQMYSMMS